MFAGSALRGAGAFLICGWELIGAGVGLATRHLLFDRSPGPDGDSDRAYNPAP